MEIDERTVEVTVAEVVSAASYDEIESLVAECYRGLPGRRFVDAVVGSITQVEAREIAEDCGVKLAEE